MWIEGSNNIDNSKEIIYRARILGIESRKKIKMQEEKSFYCFKDTILLKGSRRLTKEKKSCKNSKDSDKS